MSNVITSTCPHCGTQTCKGWAAFYEYYRLMQAMAYRQLGL